MSSPKEPHEPKEPPDGVSQGLFDAYLHELGHLLFRWNHFQNGLLTLFVSVCGVRFNGGPGDREVLSSVWHSVPNDRFQRNMLRKAAQTRFTEQQRKKEWRRPDYDPVEEDHDNKVLEEILWVLESADIIGRGRDDAAHMPVTLQTQDPIVYEPFHFFGNPIALQMRGKNILAEFALTRARIDVLSRHATRLWAHIDYALWDWHAFERPALPERPEWPRAPQSSGHKPAKGRSRKPAP